MRILQNAWTANRPSVLYYLRAPKSCPRHPSRYLSKASARDEIADMLAKPSWSVQSLLDVKTDKYYIDSTVTQKQLHHLLRLSALPLPISDEEQTKMIQTLKSQLHFVQAIRSVNTSGVEPLQSLRDESLEAEKETVITLESLQEELDKEEVIGHSKRIRTKRNDAIYSRSTEEWDPLSQASKKSSRYIVVETRKD